MKSYTPLESIQNPGYSIKTSAYLETLRGYWRIHNIGTWPKLVRKADILKSYKIEMFCLGKCVLDAESIPPIKASDCDRCRRSETAHGDNVTADMEVILIMENIDAEHAQRWKANFEQLYHLHFGGPHLTNPTVAGVCNHYATFQTVVPWSQDQGPSQPTQFTV